MTVNVTNELLLETLKAIQAKLNDMANDLSDVKADMRGLKATWRRSCKAKSRKMAPWLQFRPRSTE